jgi:hypothetical protein
MATVNEGLYRHSLTDYDKQKRQFSFNTAIVTAANHDAQKAEHDALVAAVADVTLGALDFEEFVGDRESIRPLVAGATAAAQVNIQWVVTYIDDVNSSIYNVRIPTADVTDDTLFMPNSNVWDPTDAKWVTFIAAFEAHVLSPDGNAVSLQQIVYLQ